MSDATVEDDLEAARHWWVFLIAGILWIIFAWVVLSVDYDTVWAVAVFFGFGLIAGGLMGIMIGMDAPSWRWLHISFGVIAVIAGIIALVWPGQTFLVLAAIIGWYVMFAGILDLATAFATLVAPADPRDRPDPDRLLGDRLRGPLDRPARRLGRRIGARPWHLQPVHGVRPARRRQAAAQEDGHHLTAAARWPAT
jgi:hypothetical protein